MRIVFKKTSLSSDSETNSLFEVYPHPDDHTRRITDAPGFKPFSNIIIIIIIEIFCWLFPLRLLTIQDQVTGRVEQVKSCRLVIMSPKSGTTCTERLSEYQPLVFSSLSVLIAMLFHSLSTVHGCDPHVHKKVPTRSGWYVKHSTKLQRQVQKNVQVSKTNENTVETFIYLLLTEFAVRTVSYGPSFFPRLMAQARSARVIKRGRKRGLCQPYNKYPLFIEFRSIVALD